jgi:hypothetical protein
MCALRWQELARQVSVTCIERGTVLARLWSYVNRACSRCQLWEGGSVSMDMLLSCHV